MCIRDRSLFVTLITNVVKVLHSLSAVEYNALRTELSSGLHDKRLSVAQLIHYHVSMSPLLYSVKSEKFETDTQKPFGFSIHKQRREDKEYIPLVV